MSELADEREKTTVRQHPGRPFGVTLAIIVSVIFFSILPMLWIGARLLIERQFSEERVIVLEDGTRLTDAGMSGGNFGSLASEEVLLQVGLAVGFLVIAFFAWRGRPAFMRHALVASVVTIAGISIWSSIVLLTSDPSLEGGSLDAVIDSILCGRLTLYIVIPVYVVWYLNRAPARAFYQGRRYPGSQTAQPERPDRKEHVDPA